MQVLRFLGLPAAVRALIGALAAVLVLIHAPFSTFTTPEAAAKYMLPGDESRR